jgi:hypothetical protein
MIIHSYTIYYYGKVRRASVVAGQNSMNLKRKKDTTIASYAVTTICNKLASSILK